MTVSLTLAWLSASVPPMLDPLPTKAKFVPQIRDTILSRWTEPGLFRRATEQIEGPSSGRFSSIWNASAIERSKLLWISPDFLDLTETVAAKMPLDMPWSQSGSPWDFGFCVFGRPVIGTDSKIGTKMRVDGFCWGPTYVGGRDGLALSWYSFDQIWAPLGRSDWMVDETLGEVIGRDTPLIHDADAFAVSAVEDRKLATAVWSLMQERRLVERTRWEPTNKSMKRRQGTSPVEVVHLRKEVLAARQAVSAGAKVQWKKDVDPYYRMQPYGPGQSLRRKQLIHGYTRGPEAAPYRVADVVHSLDR